MKITINELRKIIKDVITEAKKKKTKDKKLEAAAGTQVYSSAAAHDFSAPLGAYNLYKGQGAANWGPMTGPGQQVDDSIHTTKKLKEFVNRTFLDGSIPKSSYWRPLIERLNKKYSNPKDAWEVAKYTYDNRITKK